MPPPGSFMSSHRGTATETIASPPARLTLSTKNIKLSSSLAWDAGSNAAALSPSPVSPREVANAKHPSKQTMSPSSSSTGKISSTGNHAKLHKRGPSSSSLPGALSPFQTGSHPHFTTPFATYEEPDLPSNLPSSSSVPKIKPYLRKMSSAKEDQGMIDLSKSMRENDRLTGLGIQDFGPKYVSDVTFSRSSRRGQQHSRTTSIGSQVSNGSGSTRATQPFTHPMAKTPRPYTPPGGSYANSLNDEEAEEGDDFVEHDFRIGAGFRTRRSISVSSTNPTPLSQSHTASDFALVPKLTNTSQSNLSIHSNNSEKSLKKKPRQRRNTDLSQEYLPTPSSRTSFDKAFALVGRKPELAVEPPSRDEIIRAARRKFEEREANKDRKYEKEASKRRESDAKKQERQRKKSDAGLPALPQASKQVSMDNLMKKKRRKSSAAALGGVEDEKRKGGRRSTDEFRAMSYEEHRPTNAAALPRFGTRPGESEKEGRSDYHKASRKPQTSDGNWLRFSTWLQTRMLSCGGSRQ